MSITSKSPRRVLLAAWAVGKDALPDYAHRFAPKTFTQAQLFACLVLKTRMKMDYRAVAALLHDAPTLGQSIGLARVPHYTTLQKAAQRLLRSAKVSRLLASTVHVALGRRRYIDTAAADSTGFEPTHASRYYVWRAKRLGFPRKHMTYRWFGKLLVLCDCRRHVIVGAHATRGPCPDVHQLGDLLTRRVPGVKIRCAVADAGFDSEANHVMLREQMGMRSVIPPKHGRPSNSGKPPGGRWRRLMHERFNRTRYAQRSQVETVMSIIKRNLGGALGARSRWSRNREMLLKALTHNIAIIRHTFRAFLQSRTFYLFEGSNGADPILCDLCTVFIMELRKLSGLNRVIS